MRTNLLDINPIELQRIKQNMSQKEFSSKLGYKSTTTYRDNMNKFSDDILKRINNVYGIDLNRDVITHLKYRLKQLTVSNKPQNKPHKDTVASSSDVDNLLSRIK